MRHSIIIISIILGTLSFHAFAENTMTFVAGNDVCTPITVNVGGNSYTVFDYTTITETSGTVMATEIVPTYIPFITPTMLTAILAVLATMDILKTMNIPAATTVHTILDDHWGAQLFIPEATKAMHIRHCNWLLVFHAPMAKISN